MINPFKEINWKPGPAELRKFAWSLVIGFPCLAGVFYAAKWVAAGRVPDPGFFLALGGIGAAAGLVCLLVAPVARPLYYLWYGLAGCIGLVMANLIFALLYYGLFAPLGLFMRIVGRDALRLKWRRGSASYWMEAPPEPPASQYFRQY